MILAGCFPPGQILADERPEAGLPVATGLTGWPRVLYGIRSHDHGDYWGGGPTGGRLSYGELLSQVLGVMPDRELTRDLLAEARRLNIDRELPDRPLNLRFLAGDDWLKDQYGNNV